LGCACTGLAALVFRTAGAPCLTRELTGPTAGVGPGEMEDWNERQNGGEITAVGSGDERRVRHARGLFLFFLIDFPASKNLNQ
jgi:hypothetical protein